MLSRLRSLSQFRSASISQSHFHHSLYPNPTELMELVKPPISQDRASELGTWKDRKLKLSGTSWDVNGIDIAAAGLGWFSLGLKGEASLTLWTYDGIEITLREHLVLDGAPLLERPGFWLPKAISDALGSKSKLEAKKRKKLKRD